MLLTSKYLVPHKVCPEIAFHAYQLEVSESTRWHNIIYTTLLKQLRWRDKPLDMKKDREEICEVKDIVNYRRVKGVIQ